MENSGLNQLMQLINTLTEICGVAVALWIAISVIQDRFPPRHAGKLQ